MTENMTPWQHFNKIVCLSLHQSEYQIAEAEFARVGLSGIERYQAVKEIGPHQSFSHSERNILIDFYHSNLSTLLHLEDDVQFRNLDHLEAAINELPEDWDILYLGANLICWNKDEPAPERHSEHLFRVRAAWTTHAVAYHQKCVFEILAKQPEFSVKMFDQYVSDRLSEFNAYVVAPMVAYQRPRFSSIWLRHDDYSPIFEASDARLR